ncbi:hypothetical protein D3C87_863740 [compost metagenome]
MAAAHHAHETVAKQAARAHFRTRETADHARLQVDAALAQLHAFAVNLLHEAQTHAGRLRADMRKQRGTEIFNEAVARTQRERLLQLARIEPLRRSQHGQHLAHQGAHPFAQFQRARRGHEFTPGAHEQRIAGRLAQARQGAAHGRWTEAQAPRGARDAAFRKQHIEGD